MINFRRFGEPMRKPLCLLLSLFVLLAGCAKKVQQVPQPSAPAAAQKQLTTESLTFEPTAITAVGDTFWICGENETIATSLDGGITWRISHQNPLGGKLLAIQFVSASTGHAGGEGGVILSTEDGGQTWTPQSAGSAPVQTFSFSNAAHGIAILSGRVGKLEIGSLSEVQGVPFLDSSVMITSDGGKHWREAAGLRTNDDLKPYTEMLSAASLDSTHYLLGVRHPQVAVGYAVSTDAGSTWRLIHLDNVYATKVFVHAGEYWAFGIEYLDREKGGGYGAPVSLHSKDGVTWIHGLRGPNEFSTCTSQSCYLREGVFEDLYGEQPKFWVKRHEELPTANADDPHATPEFHIVELETRVKKWAIAKGRVCSINQHLQCDPVEVTSHLPARP